MKKATESYFCGLDSGGTKCEILITDSFGNTVLNKFYKGVHYSVEGVKTYTDIVSEYILRSLKMSKVSISDCLGIGIGIAGAREESDRIKLQKAFSSKLKTKKIFIFTDAMTALYGAFEGKDGLILISGTGSVLYGIINGSLTRVGGWGRIIGDEGGGYWIGKRALNLLAKEFDKGNEDKTLLAGMIKKEFGIDKGNLNDKIFHKNFDIQKIAPLVLKSAGNNCKLSLQIVDEAVADLTEHIKTFMSVTGVKKKIDMAFIGSIIENKNILSDRLKKQIKKIKNTEVVIKKHQPSYGAILLATEKINLQS